MLSWHTSNSRIRGTELPYKNTRWGLVYLHKGLCGVCMCACALIFLLALYPEKDIVLNMIRIAALGGDDGTEDLPTRPPSRYIHET